MRGPSRGGPGGWRNRQVDGQPAEPLFSNVIDSFELGEFECRSLSVGNFRTAVKRFSNLNALKEDGNGNYFGYLYLTGTRGEETFDLPPLRFFWNKRTQLVAKVDLTDLGELNTSTDLAGTISLYNVELISLLKKIARENNVEFKTFTFRTDKLPEEEALDDQMEEGSESGEASIVESAEPKVDEPEEASEDDTHNDGGLTTDETIPPEEISGSEDVTDNKKTKKGRQITRSQRQAKRGHEKNRKKKEAQRRANEKEIAECQVNLDKMESLSLVVIAESHKDDFSWEIPEVAQSFG